MSYLQCVYCSATEVNSGATEVLTFWRFTNQIIIIIIIIIR